MSESMLHDLVGSQGTKEEIQRKEASKQRRGRAENDFDYFCKTYLPHYFFSEAAEYQKILTEIFNLRAITQEQITRLRSIIKKEYWNFFSPMDEIKALIDAEPREHGKSVRGSFAFPLWCALFKKKKFMLFDRTFRRCCRR